MKPIEESVLIMPRIFSTSFRFISRERRRTHRGHGRAAYPSRLDYRYINCEVPPEKLADAVKGARAMNWAGFNLSIPHKVNVIPFLDGLGESAAVMGAVNCAVLLGGKLIGENTDGKGFLQSLRELIDPAGKSVVMFGAGGAARAIGVTGTCGHQKLKIVNRSNARQTVDCEQQDPCRANSLGEVLQDSPGSRLSSSHVVGLYPMCARIDIDMTPAQGHGWPMHYNPPRTKLIRDAEARGCKRSTVRHVVNQGVIGVKLMAGANSIPRHEKAA